MRLIYCKSKWEMGGASIERFLDRVVADGYDGVEIAVAFESEEPGVIGARCAERGLTLIAQMVTSGEGPREHRDSLDRGFEQCVAASPHAVNSQTGRDIFPLAENIRILERAIGHSERSGVPFYHETHRGRPTFCGPMTMDLIDALGGLELTADISHWMCVHESDLADQPEALEALVARSRHIHARVGFEEGPQVSNPLGESSRRWTEASLAIWRRIIECRRQAGAELLTITPEFGPIPYMPVGVDGQPVADAWETNAAFLGHLRSQLGG